MNYILECWEVVNICFIFCTRWIILSFVESLYICFIFCPWWIISSLLRDVDVLGVYALLMKVVESCALKYIYCWEHVINCVFLFRVGWDICKEFSTRRYINTHCIFEFVNVCIHKILEKYTQIKWTFGLFVCNILPVP